MAFKELPMEMEIKTLLHNEWPVKVARLDLPCRVNIIILSSIDSIDIYIFTWVSIPVHPLDLTPVSAPTLVNCEATPGHEWRADDLSNRVEC